MIHAPPAVVIIFSRQYVQVINEVSGNWLLEMVYQFQILQSFQGRIGKRAHAVRLVILYVFNLEGFFS